MPEQKNNQGYAAITATILMLVISLTIISAFTFFTLQEVNTNRAYTKAVDAHYVSEGGIEDAVYRIVTGKQTSASELLGVGNGTTTVTITTSGNKRTIRSEGVRDVFQNNLETTIDITTSGVNFYYGVQVGDGGITMGNGAQVIGNVYSNGSISGGSITGTATVAGGITDNPQFEWTIQNADQFFATTTASRDIAQSFTAPANGLLNKVSVYLAKVGVPTQNLTLRITTDNTGKPTYNGGLASFTITPSMVGTSASWVDVSFASPPTLTNGTKYWIVLDYGTNSTTNYWNWRKDNSDGYASNTGRYANDWSSSSATWVNGGGDLAFRVWVGGVNTNITNTTITVAGHANLFVNDTIGGSSCPNANCFVENPPHQNLPISDGVIQDWRDEAAAGGTCITPICDGSGNLQVNGTTVVTIGPKKINGSVDIQNGGTLIVNGTLWITGNLNLSNNANMRLAAGYGSLSGVVVVDGIIDVSNNCTIQGSGSSGSYLMVVSAKNTPASTVIDISNNAFGAIYYAPHGRIHFNNNAGAKEVSAYGFDLDNNATVTYESGLANVQFSSGPSGGYTVNQWQEVR